MSSSLLPQSTGAGLPQPEENTVRVDATIAVASISGPPQEVWDRLVRQLNSATQDAQMALLNYQGASADYRLQGYVIASPARTSISVSYIWDVFDKSGGRVGRTAGSQKVDRKAGGDPWSSVPDEVLKLIADQAVLAVRTRSIQSLGAGGSGKGAPAPVLPETPSLAPRQAPPGTASARREDAMLQQAFSDRN